MESISRRTRMCAIIHRPPPPSPRLSAHARRSPLNNASHCSIRLPRSPAARMITRGVSFLLAPPALPPPAAPASPDSTAPRVVLITTVALILPGGPGGEKRREERERDAAPRGSRRERNRASILISHFLRIMNHCELFSRSIESVIGVSARRQKRMITVKRASVYRNSVIRARSELARSL